MVNPAFDCVSNFKQSIVNQINIQIEMLMAKEKFTLQDLKVQSFVTTLEGKQMDQIKGGYMVIKGRKFTYRSRWTFVDTRSDVNDAILPPDFNGFGG